MDDDFKPIYDQWRYLTEMQTVSTLLLAQLIRIHVKETFIDELSTTSESKRWKTPVPPSFTKADFPEIVKMVKANMLYIPLNMISGKVVTYFKRIASFRNPRFYQNRAMKISNHKVPSIITCADVLDDYIALPRGCEEAVCDFFSANDIQFEIEDKIHNGFNAENMAT